jgi:uridine kinase
MDLPGRLAHAVEALGRDRVLVGIDGPEPREVRYARGELSAEGYYRDSLDLDRLIDGRLRPFRDLTLFASTEEVERRYRARYLPGQALFRREADPERVAHVLVDNDDVTAPQILRWSSPAAS